MRHRITTLLVLLGICLISCNVEQKSNLDIDSLVSSLKTIEKKEKFLISIDSSDQNARDPERKLDILKRNNYNTNSHEYQEYLKRMMYVDSINFIKVKKYLEIHGYPTFGSHDYRVSLAIRLVCLHQSNYQKQLELFPYIHKAYKTNLIEADHFSFLLNSMYQFKFRKQHPQAISNEENIKQLLEKLKLN